MDEVEKQMKLWLIDILGEDLYDELKQYNAKFLDGLYFYELYIRNSLPRNDSIDIYIPDVNDFLSVVSLNYPYNEGMDTELNEETLEVVYENEDGDEIRLHFGRDPTEHVFEQLLYLQNDKIKSGCRTKKKDFEEYVNRHSPHLRSKILSNLTLACKTKNDQWYFGFDTYPKFTKLVLFYGRDQVNTGDNKISAHRILRFSQEEALEKIPNLKNRYAFVKLGKGRGFYVYRVIIEEKTGNSVSPRYADENTIEYKVATTNEFSSNMKDKITILGSKRNVKG
jgi:hypothetical protein